MVEHAPVYGLDKEIGCAARPVIDVWVRAYTKNPNTKGLDETEKQEIREYLNSLDPEARKALTNKNPNGKSILSRASAIARNQTWLKKAA